MKIQTSSFSMKEIISANKDIPSPSTKEIISVDEENIAVNQDKPSY